MIVANYESEPLALFIPAEDVISDMGISFARKLSVNLMHPATWNVSGSQAREEKEKDVYSPPPTYLACPFYARSPANYSACTHLEIQSPWDVE